MSLNHEVNHEVPSRKNFGPMKHPQDKFVDPGNTHEKNVYTHEIPTRNIFRPTKYPQEKTLVPQNTHEGTMTRDPQNLAQSIKNHDISSMFERIF